jgi:hypothetical protein
MAKNKAKPKRDIELKGVAGTMQDLIGSSVDIKMPDGGIVIVPSERSGNRVANMILAAQIRHLIQESIKSYKDKDMLATPKDLKDLAEAAKSLHQFSGEVYKEDEPMPNAPKKIREPSKADDDISFDSAIETPPIEPEKPKA